MLYRLLATTAVVLALSSPAMAGAASADRTQTAQATSPDSTQPSATEQAPGATTEPSDMTGQGTGTGTSTDMGTGTGTGTTTGQDTTTPPDTTTGQDMTTGQDSTTMGATDSGTSDEEIVTTQATDEWRAAEVIGMKVTNASDEDVGKVNDLVLAQDGNIRAVVLSVGGFLGVGDKLVAMPWEKVDFDPANDMVLVNMTKDELEAAPAYKTQEDLAEEQATPPAGTDTGMGTVPPATTQ